MDELTIDDEHFFRIHGAIEQGGFFTMAVMGTSSTPTWAYTIGFLGVCKRPACTLGAHTAAPTSAQTATSAVPSFRPIPPTVDGGTGP